LFAGVEASCLGADREMVLIRFVGIPVFKKGLFNETESPGGMIAALVAGLRLSTTGCFDGFLDSARLNEAPQYRRSGAEALD
jgi:hypothetical protein